MSGKVLGLSFAGTVLAAAVAVAAANPTRADADSLKQKVAGITAFGESPEKRPNRTTVTENELNAFLTFEARDQLPAGVVDPTVSIVGGGRVMAREIGRAHV